MTSFKYLGAIGSDEFLTLVEKTMLRWFAISQGLLAWQRRFCIAQCKERQESQTEEEVGRQYQGVVRDGLCYINQGS